MIAPNITRSNNREPVNGNLENPKAARPAITTVRTTVTPDTMTLFSTNRRMLTLTGAAISARLGYSYPYLERIFRARFDRSIHQEVLHSRVQAAALELGMGKPIKQVAKDVGFSDYYYFLKVFKRIRGISPGAFQVGHRSI